MWRRRGGAALGLSQQRRTEDADDGQVEQDAQDQGADRPLERGCGPLSHEERPARHHVGDHAFHLEVCAHHGADVEELVAVADVVEAARGQPLWEVGGKQEAGEAGEEEVVTVTAEGVTGAAATAAAEEDPVEQRSRVEDEGDHEGSRPQNFAPLWELQLQEPGVAGQAGAEDTVSHCNGDKVLLQPAVHPAVGDDVVTVADGTTQAVEAERSVVEEVADVSGLRGHGAEGVGAAGGEGVNADEQHVDQQWPGVAVAQEVEHGAEHAEAPQEVPGRQEVGPDVDCLIGHLEAAEDAVQRRALRVPVARDDAVLPEHLRHLVDIIEAGQLDAQHVSWQPDGAPPPLAHLDEPCPAALAAH